MALYIPHRIFRLTRLLYVRPETFGPYYVHLATTFWLPSGEIHHRRHSAALSSYICASCFRLRYTYRILQVSSASLNCRFEFVHVLQLSLNHLCPDMSVFLRFLLLLFLFSTYPWEWHINCVSLLVLQIFCNLQHQLRRYTSQSGASD